MLRSVAPIGATRWYSASTRRARRDGKKLPGYLQEPNVAKDSRTETFVAMRLEIQNWRWQGVPFYLRTGKACRGAPPAS